MKEKQQESSTISRSDAFHLTLFVANIHAACITPFIRSGFGIEHPGMFGIFAMVLMLLVAASDPTGATGVYFCFWICALAYRGAQTLTLIRQGAQIHSRFAGHPWLAMSLPFVRKEFTATGLIEPLLCLFTGVLLFPVSQPLCALVMGGFISFLVRAGVDCEVNRKRLQAMQDARIEQEHYSRQFRKPFEE